MSAAADVGVGVGAVCAAAVDVVALEAADAPEPEATDSDCGAELGGDCDAAAAGWLPQFDDASGRRPQQSGDSDFGRQTFEPLDLG